jgi:hypothetical protein
MAGPNLNGGRGKEEVREMTHAMAQSGTREVSRVVCLAGLSALLLALWGSPAAAVTLKATDVAPLGGLCASLVRGLPGESSLEPDASLPEGTTVACATAEAGSEAPDWARPDVSAKAVLQAALAGLSVATSAPCVDAVAQEHEEPTGLFWRPLAARGGGGPTEQSADALTRSLDDHRVTTASSVTSPESAMGAALKQSGLGPVGWVALLPIPGLLGMMLAFSGIIRNFGNPEPDQLTLR